MSSYPSTPAVADQFDTGPLSWVMEEIRAALARTSALVLSSSGLDAEAGAAALGQAAKVPRCRRHASAGAGLAGRHRRGLWRTDRIPG